LHQSLFKRPDIIEFILAPVVEVLVRVVDVLDSMSESPFDASALIRRHNEPGVVLGVGLQIQAFIPLDLLKEVRVVGDVLLLDIEEIFEVPLEHLKLGLYLLAVGLEVTQLQVHALHLLIRVQLHVDFSH